MEPGDPFQPTRGLPVFLLAVLLAVSACTPRSYSLTPAPTAYTGFASTEYYLYLPSSYMPDRDWPLLVGIHGYSGDGRQCLEMWQQAAESEGFVLVCPSLADNGGGWSAEQGETELHTVLTQVRREVRLQRRFFLAGYSAGGEFAQIYAFNNPGEVKAVALLSAGNYYAPWSDAKVIPFLLVLGENDDPLSLGNAELFVDQLQNEGYTVELEVIPASGHAVTPQALERTIRFFHQVYALDP